MPTRLPTGERVAKLMQQDNREERKVLYRRADRRDVSMFRGELIGGDQEPGEVQINLDPDKLKQPKGPALHVRASSLDESYAHLYMGPRPA